MKNYEVHIKVFKTAGHIKTLFFLYFLILQFKLSMSGICNPDIYLSDSSCFNNIIKYNDIRAGHFATKKNGDLIIEYSFTETAKSRLFYGWKENGRGFFNDEYIRKKDLSDSSSNGRYESRNIFVSLKGDTNKDKEYLFSTSSYKSVTELHDLENDNYKIKYSDTFNGKRIFSFVFSLLGTTITGQNYYFLFWTTPSGNNPEIEHGDNYVLKKFAFTSFSLDSYDSSTPNKLETKFSDRVVSGFIMKEESVLVILFLNKINQDGDVYAQYTIRFYDYSLNKIGSDLVNYYGLLKRGENIVENVGLYSNSIYLKDKTGLFIYFHINKLVFQIFSFYKDNGNYKKNDITYKELSKGFDSDITLNDVHKINDYKIAIVTTKYTGTKVYFILLDFFGAYNNYKFRIYKYKIFSNYKLKKEMEIYSYKEDFLVFTSTYGKTDSDKPYNSILIFFSYPNGTDFELDMSYYFKDSGNYDSTKNLFTDLINTMKIENNIFRYKKVEKIKLVSIPDEILLYNGNDGSLLINGSIMDINYVLKQNTNLIKTDKLYYLYYQFIAETPSYSELYNNDIEIIDNTDYSSYYSTKNVYGRNNKLSFKLCHQYCSSCYNISESNNDQECVACLSEYTYDYLTYINNFTGNCVPKGEMYDIEEHKLKKCEDAEHKYYHNTSRNDEIYCFKYIYDCPDIYPYLNMTTNECLNYTPPVPTTFPEIIPTTLPEYIPTTIISKMPTTLPEYIPTTITSKIPKTIPEKIPSTIPDFTPTTILENIPTTIPEKIQTTISEKIPSTIPEKIPTTIPEKIPTTIPEKIPSTIPEKIPSTIPNKVIQTTYITTIPNNIMTTILIVKPTIIYKCNYYTVKTDCIFTNLTDVEIYIKLKHDIISTYPVNGISILVNGSNSSSFHLTNTLNENNTLNTKNDLSTINMGQCESILRDIYHIENDQSIIILKYFNLDQTPNERNVQYELYHPISYEKLNLSYCENSTYNLFIPIDLDETIVNLVNNAKSQGYDLFDPEDDFYKKICTPYTSGNGTDVLLDDRVSFYHNKVENMTTCPENCVFISYSVETKYLKCECNINNNDITTLDLKHIIGSNSYKSFYSSLKYSNYKVMICYNLVFNFKIFCHNYGSIIILLLFIIYIGFMIYYIYKDISPLKISISKLVFEKFDNQESISIKIITKEVGENNNTNKKNKHSEKSTTKNAKKPKKIKFPPKRMSKNILKKENSDKKTINENIGSYLVKKNIITQDKNVGQNNLKSNGNNINIFNPKNHRTKNSKINLKLSSVELTKQKLNEDKLDNNLEIKNKNFQESPLINEKLDNFELNNLDYIPACELDNRSFIKTYLSVLMREHIFLITFFAWNDYNLFYIKIERFIIQFCTSMAMNGLFFSDESMHNLYVNSGEYGFVQQIPQMLYSLIIGHILEVILCYLSLTDTSIYMIKELSKSKENASKIIQILNCLNKKLIVFFVFTYLLFLFYWYFISAFCAVYQNTQIIFIRDSLTSFITSMIDPFLIYAGTTILRVISLVKCCKKKLRCVYGISQFLPIF